MIIYSLIYFSKSKAQQSILNHGDYNYWNSSERGRAKVTNDREMALESSRSFFFFFLLFFSLSNQLTLSWIRRKKQENQK